ncbi:MAG: DUF4040 domain-containing protein [Pseudomonadota bacterium]
MELLINMVLLTLLAAVTVAIARQRNLFGVVILAGIYSFLMASVMIVLDAPDVAMTEASVGAGVSTVFLLATLHLTKAQEQRVTRKSALPFTFASLVTVVLIYGTWGLPPFGLADNPPHQFVAPYYLANSVPETTIPNVVTSVLGSYRGFDTLGETAVVFTAAIGVLLLLRQSKRRGPSDGSSGGSGDAS